MINVLLNPKAAASSAAQVPASAEAGGRNCNGNEDVGNDNFLQFTGRVT